MEMGGASETESRVEHKQSSSGTPAMETGGASESTPTMETGGTSESESRGEHKQSSSGTTTMETGGTSETESRGEHTQSSVPGGGWQTDVWGGQQPAWASPRA